MHYSLNPSLATRCRVGSIHLHTDSHANQKHHPNTKYLLQNTKYKIQTQNTKYTLATRSRVDQCTYILIHKPTTNNTQIQITFDKIQNTKYKYKKLNTHLATRCRLGSIHLHTDSQGNHKHQANAKYKKQTRNKKYTSLHIDLLDQRLHTDKVQKADNKARTPKMQNTTTLRIVPPDCNNSKLYLSEYNIMSATVKCAFGEPV